jgi:hypothetical protein
VVALVEMYSDTDPTCYRVDYWDLFFYSLFETLINKYVHVKAVGKYDASTNIYDVPVSYILLSF